MKKIDIGQASGTLANLGVIAVFVVLAIEIHQGTEVQESQMRFLQGERQTELIEEVIRNPELLAAILNRESGQALDPVEERLLEHFAFRILVSWQWIYGEVVRGSMPPDRLRTMHTAFRAGLPIEADE